MTHAPPPTPIGPDSPNFDTAFGQNLPILCTILVGVEGLLFVTMGTVKDLPHDQLEFFPLIFWDFAKVTLPLRETVMVATLICSVAYIGSGYLGVLAQIKDSSAALRDGRLTRPANNAANAAQFDAYLRRLQSLHDRYLRQSIWAFNLGTALFPLGLIALFSGRLLSTLLDAYAVAVMYAAVQRFR